jgi:DNA-binding SARP family transcriptional activator
VARGTQHRKRRPTANAHVATAPAAKAKAKAKQDSWEDQLFFSRLRRHAKWMFAFLALVFAFSFIIFGVGSGSTGIGDVLQNFFSGITSTGSSLSSLQKATVKHPKEASTWRALATKLETDQKEDRAIVALQHYVKLAPKDESGLAELAGLYLRRARDYETLYETYQEDDQPYATDSPFTPKSTTKIGKAYTDTTALGSPITSLESTNLNTQATNAVERIGPLEKNAEAVYKQLIKLNPTDATNQFQLAQSAEVAGDNATAIKAYNTFLKLAPNDALASTAKTQLKQLKATATATSNAKAG